MTRKAPEELAEEHAFNIFQERYESLISEDRHVYAEAVDAFLAGYQAALNHNADASKMVDHIPDMEKMVWISVKDRLPEEDEPVLVYGQVLNDNPEVLGVRRMYKGDQEWKRTWESEDSYIYREDDVSHWMPLPKPPTEEE